MKNDISYLSFSKIKLWDKYCGFVYDYIFDHHIIFAKHLMIKYPSIKDNLNINIDWLDDYYICEKSSIKLSILHACRISKLIDIIKEKTVDIISPVSFDTYSNILDVYSGILDGHHRIRALQYLKIPYFPAYCNGDIEIIESLCYKKGIQINEK